jgi:hypothetical protein
VSPPSPALITLKGVCVGLWVCGRGVCLFLYIIYMHGCVCVCVCERERERERESSNIAERNFPFAFLKARES